MRTGRLPATRDGAHWLVDPIELERLAAQSSPRPRLRARAAVPARLAARLVAGDEAGAWQIVESTLASGADADDVLLDVIAAAVRDIGDGWAAGSIAVSDEHRATVVVRRIVGRMGPRFTRRGPKRGMIVIGAPEDEEHAVPARSSPTCSEPLASRPTTLAPTPQRHRSSRRGSRRAPRRRTDRSDHRRARGAAAFAVLRHTGVTVPLFVGGAAVTDADHARRLGDDHWTGRDGRTAVTVVERVLHAGSGPPSSRA